MLTVADIEDKVMDLTDHANLGSSRIRAWMNMVSYEFAARLVGCEITGMAVSPIKAWTSTISWTTGTPAWAGEYIQSSTISTDSEWASIAANTGMLFPKDALYINQIFHASVSGTWLANATGTQGIFNQKYIRSEIGDLCSLANGELCTNSIGTDQTVSSIYYAGIGAVFHSTESSYYGPQFMVWPHPQCGATNASTVWALVEHIPAPTAVTTSPSDDSKANVYMSKYPDVYLSGLLRYVWLYLGRVEDYMRAKKEWEDGLVKVAAMSRPLAHVARIGGIPDHNDLRYLGR